MAVTRLEDLQDCFPQLSLGTIQDVINQVGAEQAVDALLEMGSDSGARGAEHSVDIEPSQLLPSLFPDEEAPAPAAAVARLQGSGATGYDYAPPPRMQPPASKPAPQHGPWGGGTSRGAASNDSTAASHAAAVKAVPPPPLPPRAWWPPWQGGQPKVASPPAAPLPQQLVLQQQEEEEDIPFDKLLQTLQSGNEDTDSDAGGVNSEAESDSPPSKPAVAAAASSLPKPPTRSRPYEPHRLAKPSESCTKKALALAAAGGGGGGKIGKIDSEEDVTQALLVDLIGDDNVPSQQTAGGPAEEKQLVVVAEGAPEEQLDWVNCDMTSHAGAPALPLGQTKVYRSVTHADFGQGSDMAGAPCIHDLSVSRGLEGVVVGVAAGCGGATAQSVCRGSASGSEAGSGRTLRPKRAKAGQAATWGSGDDCGWPPCPYNPVVGKRHGSGASVADAMYLSGSIGGAGCGSRASSHPPSSAGSAAGDASSHDGGGTDSESVLDFLATGFPEQELPFLRDVLAAKGGDANVATAALLEMRDEAEAHCVAAQLQELQPSAAEDELSHEHKVVVLEAAFSELSRSEAETALEAHAGSLQAAATILALHASQEEARRAAVEAEAADAAIARRLAEEQFADAAAGRPGSGILPALLAASPEDLAAIAAMEAAAVRGWGGEGKGVAAGQQQPPTRVPSPETLAALQASRAAAMVAARRPPPTSPALRGEAGKLANDRLYNEVYREVHQLWAKHDKCLTAAAVASRRGQGTRVRELQRQAAELRAAAHERGAAASDAIFRAKNLALNAGHTIKVDLHGQHVTQALAKMERLLGAMADLPTCPAARVITGKGKHSAGEAKLRPAVRQFLEARRWPYHEAEGYFDVFFDGRPSR